MHHRLARALHRLGDRDRHFARLAVAEADAAIAVADHGQRREAHLAAALDGLRHAVDGDQLLEEAIAAFAIRCLLPCFTCVPPSKGADFCLRLGRLELCVARERDWGSGMRKQALPISSPIPESRLLELQSRLARRIGQRLDATVIAETRAVERDLLDARLQRALGDGLADRGGGRFVLGALEVAGDAPSARSTPQR